VSLKQLPVVEIL